MKISIDTTEDSHDHIKEAIALLQNIVGSSAPTTSSSSDGGYVNIFAENPTTSEPAPEPEQPAAPEQAFFNIFGDDPAPSQPSEPTPEPETPQEPTQDQVFGMPVMQAASEPAPQADQPSVQTTTPTREPPKNAPPDVDMFDFFSKAKTKINPY